MNYIQALFSLLQRAAVRHLHHRHVLEADDAAPRAGSGWSPARSRRWPAAFRSEGALGSREPGSASHRAARGRRSWRRRSAFVVDLVLCVGVSLVTDGSGAGVRAQGAGAARRLRRRTLVRTPSRRSYPWYRRTHAAGRGSSLAMVTVAERGASEQDASHERSTLRRSRRPASWTSGTSSAALLGDVRRDPGADGAVRRPGDSRRPAASNANLVGRASCCCSSAAAFMAWAQAAGRSVVPEHVEPVLDDPTRPAPKKKPRSSH